MHKHPTIPYNPTGNSMVERANQEAIHQLRLFVQQYKVQPLWSVYLPLIQASLNNMYVRSIGMSPHRLRYGDRSLLYPSLDCLELNTSDIADKYISAVNDQIQVVRQIAIFVADASMTKLILQSPQADTTLAIGDFIIVEHTSLFRPHKLAPNWLGPFRITKVDGNTIMAKHVNTLKESVFDIHQR